VTYELIGWTEKMKEKIFFNLQSPSEVLQGGKRFALIIK
jgi:hypothetical protein